MRAYDPMSTITSVMTALPGSILPAGSRPKRPHVVWGSLVLGMTVVGGTMLVLEDRPGRFDAPLPSSLPAAAAIDATSSTTGRINIAASVPLDAERWSGIVIHHSGSAMGSLDSIARQHESAGLKSLGYHFVVCNGQGGTDGRVNAGPRWMAQLPGAHTKGPQSELLNRRTIGICLVGDGESREFTEAQMASLVTLVAELQAQFKIPASAVVLHRDVAATASPGRLFPEASFRARLAAAR